MTVTWTEEQLEENSGCTDMFEVKKEEQRQEQRRSRGRSREEVDIQCVFCTQVGVEHDGVERKVCSVKRQDG